MNIVKLKSNCLYCPLHYIKTADCKIIPYCIINSLKCFFFSFVCFIYIVKPITLYSRFIIFITDQQDNINQGVYMFFIYRSSKFWRMLKNVFKLIFDLSFIIKDCCWSKVLWKHIKYSSLTNKWSDSQHSHSEQINTTVQLAVNRRDYAVEF